MFVYLITNLINGKRYVGQTIRSLEQRLESHAQERSGCKAMRSAIYKYGLENFSISSICEVFEKPLADEFEKEYIVRYNTKFPNGYNLTNGGEGFSGSHSDITKKALSEKLKGNKCATGSIRSLEVKAKLSAAAKKQMEELKSSPEKYKTFLEASSRPHIGAKRTEETKAKMRKAWELRKLRTSL